MVFAADICGSLWRFHALAHFPQRHPHKTHCDADMAFGWIWMHFAHVTGLQLVNVDEAAADAKYQKLCSEVDVLEMVQTGFESFWLYAHKLETCRVYQIFFASFLGAPFCKKNAKTLSTVFNMWAETTKESAAAAVSTQQVAKQAPSANWFLLFFEVQSVVLGCHVLNCAIDRNSNCTSILQYFNGHSKTKSYQACLYLHPPPM